MSVMICEKQKNCLNKIKLKISKNFIVFWKCCKWIEIKIQKQSNHNL